VEPLSVSDDENWSAPSSLLPPASDDTNSPGCHCARVSYVLPAERWSGKRKRHSDPAGTKLLKTFSKPTGVDGLGNQSQNQSTQPDDTPGRAGTPSPTQSPSSSLTLSSPTKHVPVAPVPPLPPSLPSPVSHSRLRKHSSRDANGGIKTHPPDKNDGRRPSVSDDAVRTRLSSGENAAKSPPPLVESGPKTRLSSTDGGSKVRSSVAASKNVSATAVAVSPSAAAISCIVGMSPPATPVMSEAPTSVRRSSKQKGRVLRDPNSLPCKGGTTLVRFNNCCCYKICWMVV